MVRENINYMKTAEEFIRQGNTGSSLSWILSNLDEEVLDVMRGYARHVAEQTLKDATDNAKVKSVDYGSFGIASYEYEVDKESILSTPIHTP